MKESNPYSGQSSQQEGQKTCVWSILSIIFAFLVYFLGFIFGIAALVKINKNPRLKGKGLAIAGIIISCLVGLILMQSRIGALAYFGVFNTGGPLPDKCIFETGLTCRDFRVFPDSLALELQNGMGKDMIITQVSAKQTDGAGECVWTGNQFVQDQTDYRFVLTNCEFVEEGYQTMLQLYIDYHDPINPNSTKVIYGEMRASFE